MPIGAAKIAYQGYQVSAGGYTGADETVHSLSNLTYNARSYQIPKISYAGDDSSGQPVFFVGTRSSGGDFVCSLIRRNNDGTISESSVKTLKSTDERFEAQGVAGLDSSGNPVGVTIGTYRVSGVIKTDAYANQIDLDNLSLGTTYSDTDFTSVSSNAGFAYATYYPGNDGVFGGGYRNSGIRTARLSVTSSSITAGNELLESSYGDGVYQGIYGLTYQSSSPYTGDSMHMSANGNGNQHGAAYFDGTAAGGSVYSDSLTVGLARTEPFEFAFDKMLTVARNGSNAEMIVSTINWPQPSTGNPTFTNGSVTSFSDEASWNSSFCGAADLTNNKIYILHSHSTNGWQLRPITASGTTPSEGTAISVGVTTTNWGTGNESNAACFAESAQGDLFCALIDDTSGNNPQIYITDTSA